MNSVSVGNQEEAAFVAAEFLSSLDNLPNEVQHLLDEIRHKETRVQELQQEIQKDTNKYIRNGLKSVTPKEGKENGKDKDSKESLIPGRVSSAHAELDKLCADKINLAAHLVETLTRVNARLEHDLTKVISLSGEPPQEQYEVRGGYVVGPAQLSTTAPAVLAANTSVISSASARTVKEVQENLRAALASDAVVGSPVLNAGQAQKRRRLNTGASATSNNAGSRGHTPQAPPRSRLVNQVHPSPPRGRRPASPQSTAGYDDDAGDGEGDEDLDEDQESGDAEDQKLYCYCQKTSYGEMIECENPNCPKEWFHLGCVGLKGGELPEHWYCDICLQKQGMGGNNGARKARRKAA